MAHQELPSEPTSNTSSLSAILDLVARLDDNAPEDFELPEITEYARDDPTPYLRFGHAADPGLERQAPAARETTAYDSPTNPTLYSEIPEITHNAPNNDHPSLIGSGNVGEGASPGGGADGQGNTPGTLQPSPTNTDDDNPGDDEPCPPPYTVCTALTKRGTPCQFAARRESGLCINHDPAYAQKQRENLLKGARKSAQRRKRPPVALRNVDLSRRSSIQALVDTVITMELAGQLSITQSRNIIRLLSIATRNLRNSDHGWTTHGAFQHASNYLDARETLATDISALLNAEGKGQ